MTRGSLITCDALFNHEHIMDNCLVGSRDNLRHCAWIRDRALDARPGCL
jgi:hypothetical protein